MRGKQIETKKKPKKKMTTTTITTMTAMATHTPTGRRRFVASERHGVRGWIHRSTGGGELGVVQWRI